MSICGRKPKKLRCIIAAALCMLMISGLCGGFSAKADNEVPEEYKLQTVYVSNGDTIWTLVDEYCSYHGDIRKAIFEVKKINGIENGQIYPGEVIYIPSSI